MPFRHTPLDWTSPGSAPGPDRAPGPVDVVVPVYGAAVELAACLASLVRHTDLDRHRLVLVIDGPQESAVEEALSAVAGRPESQMTILRSAERRGVVGGGQPGGAGSGRGGGPLHSHTQGAARRVAT